MKAYIKHKLQHELLLEYGLNFCKSFDRLPALLRAGIAFLSVDEHDDNNSYTKLYDVNQLLSQLTRDLSETRVLLTAFHRLYADSEMLMKLLVKYLLKMNTKYFYEEESVFRNGVLLELGMVYAEMLDSMDQVSFIVLNSRQARWFRSSRSLLDLADGYYQSSSSFHSDFHSEGRSQLLDNIQAFRAAIESMVSIDDEMTEYKSEGDFESLQKELNLMERHPGHALFRCMELLELNNLLTPEAVLKIEKNPEQAVVMATELGLLDPTDPIDKDILELQSCAIGLEDYATGEIDTISSSILAEIESFVVETDNLVPESFYSRLHGLFSTTERSVQSQRLSEEKSSEPASPRQ